MSGCEVCSSDASVPMFERAGHQFVRCVTCGLERISPQPSDATLGAIYGAHYYDAWGLHDNEDAVARLKRSTFRGVLGALPPPRPGARLLDCGAATGFLLEVARELGYDPYGLELSEFGAQAIAARFGAEHAFCGQLEAMQFPGVAPGDFAVITMCDYIEHVRDPAAILRQARRWLGEHGSIVLTTPDVGSLSRRLLGHGWTHYKLEHLFYFDRSTLTTLLRDAGFGRVEFHPLRKSLTLEYVADQFERYPHPVLSRVARGLRRVTPAALRLAPVPVLTGEMLAVAHT